MSAPATKDARARHLLMWSAQTASTLPALTRSLQRHLAGDTPDELRDVAFTLQTGRPFFEHRRCVVAGSREEAAAALADPRPGSVLSMTQQAADRPVGLLIAGVGEQYPGLAGRLHATEPVFRERVEAGRSALLDLTGNDLLAEFIGMRPAAGPGDTIDFRRLVGRGPAPAEAGASTDVLQPALFTIWYALAETLREWGIRPAVMLGYSLGEYVAACLSGVFSFEDALGIVTRRAELISLTPAGAMAAMALGESAAAEAIDDLGLPIDIAGVNTPSITVTAGPADAMARFRTEMSARGVASRPLRTSHAFHSRLLDSAAEDLTAWIRERVTLHPPAVPYLSNVTGRVITESEAADPAYWARHMCSPVRFREAAATLLRHGDLPLLEIGPGESLGAMVRANPGCEPSRRGSIIATLPSDADPRPADQVLAEAVGRLWLAGARIDFAAYHRCHGSRQVVLPDYPAAPRRRAQFERVHVRNNQG